MKNDSNPIIRSEKVTIDMHICAALSESRSSGEIYFAAIAPDMELTVITLDEAPDILPCFDEDDAYLNIPDSSLLLSYNPAQVLKLAGKRYLTGGHSGAHQYGWRVHLADDRSGLPLSEVPDAPQRYPDG